MASNSIRLIIIFTATLAFNFLFWQEKSGLNLFLFDLIIGVGLYMLYPQKWQDKKVVATVISTLLLALFVVINNTLFSKIIHLLSALCFLGFIHSAQLEFVGTAFGIGLSNLLEGPKKAIAALQSFSTALSQRQGNIQPAWRWVQLSVVPMVLVAIFYGLYALANPAFAKLSGELWAKVIPWISPGWGGYRILFFFTGFIVVSALLWPSHFFAKFKERFKNKNLIRKRTPSLFSKMMDLKMEYRSALILIISLNILLGIVNTIDIWYVWLGNGALEAALLSSYVHEGTWLLIVAILLGMIVLGYYFRKNLNFLPGNTLLKIAAYAWIIQNGILAFSVGMRNFRYIEHYGLAYKRLGVILFLILVMIGLFTMFVKVQQRKSFYYLLYQNAWACYFVLIAASIINWDILITRYNLSGKPRTELDINYLTNDLSDKNLYLLLQYFPDVIDEESNVRGSLSYLLKNKRNKFLHEQSGLTWLSWNYPDYRNNSFLKKQGY